MATVTLHDDLHAEDQGEYATVALAMAEVERRAGVPWHEAPNRAPCTGWENCGRAYVLIETLDGQEVRTPVLKIDSNGLRWLRREV